MASLEAVTISVTLNEPEQRVLQHETSEPYGQEVRAGILEKLRESVATEDNPKDPREQLDDVLLEQANALAQEGCDGSGKRPCGNASHRADCTVNCPGCTHPECPRREGQ